MKLIFGRQVPTLWANVLLLWGMTLVFMAALKVNFFPWLIALLDRRVRAA